MDQLLSRSYESNNYVFYVKITLNDENSVFCTEGIITNETMKLNAFLNIDRRHRNKYLASLVCMTV